MTEAGSMSCKGFSAGAWPRSLLHCIVVRHAFVFASYSAVSGLDGTRCMQTDGHRTLHQTKLKQGERKHCPRFVDILGWKVCSSLDEAWGYLFSKPLYQQGQF
ncbi:hypothetical protein M758_2G183200 [Ceratodon purpureus]|nr:hypothetical protein M758_2G183200 [Ceratodon purpureus]